MNISLEFLENLLENYIGYFQKEYPHIYDDLEDVVTSYENKCELPSLEGPIPLLTKQESIDLVRDFFETLDPDITKKFDEDLENGCIQFYSQEEIEELLSTKYNDEKQNEEWLKILMLPIVNEQLEIFSSVERTEKEHSEFIQNLVINMLADLNYQEETNSISDFLIDKENLETLKENPSFYMIYARENKTSVSKVNVKRKKTIEDARSLIHEYFHHLIEKSLKDKSLKGDTVELIPILSEKLFIKFLESKNYDKVQIETLKKIRNIDEQQYLNFEKPAIKAMLEKKNNPNFLLSSLNIIDRLFLAKSLMDLHKGEPSVIEHYYGTFYSKKLDKLSYEDLKEVVLDGVNLLKNKKDTELVSKLRKIKENK